MVSGLAALAAVRSFDVLRSRAAALPVRVAPAGASSTQEETSRRPRTAEEATLHAEPAARESLGAGLVLSGSFRVVQAYGLFYGALPFVVEGEGERFQVDVLRSVPSGTSGVFATEHFTLFVHGRGGAAQERGARALGYALEQRVEGGFAIPALASFDERSRHADACFNVDFVAVHV